MSQNQLVTVAFNGQSLLATLIESKPYVAMKPICENIGLDWAARYTRINRHKILKASIVMTTTVAEDGKQREMLFLQLSKLNGWLFGVDANRVKEEVRPKLERYQAECFDVLEKHFTQPMRPYNPAIDYERISPAQAQQLKELVERVVASGVQTHAETWSRLHSKYKINSYLQLPASRCDEARAYLHAKLPPHTRPEPKSAPALVLQPGQMIVSRAKMAALWRDLGTLCRRVDALGIAADDLPPSWWSANQISAE